MVWFHDGEKSPAPIVPLIASGYAVASVGYRSGQVADALAAVAWLRANAAKYGLDAGQIALAGSDKGGQIASIAGRASGVQAVVAIYPAAEKIAQPEPPANAGLSPAFLVMHGTGDTVAPVGQSEKLVFDLKAAGADASLEYVARAGHDLRQMVNPVTTEIIANFLDRKLRNNTHERAEVTSFPLPNDAWEDPLAFDTFFTFYKSYPTPVRGVNARGSYRVYLPPDYNDNKVAPLPGHLLSPWGQ